MRWTRADPWGTRRGADMYTSCARCSCGRKRLRMLPCWYFHCRAAWYNDTWACTHLVIYSVHCCVPRRQLLPHLPCAAKSVGWSGKGCGWLATISAVDGQQCGLRSGAEDKEKACAPATGIHIKLIQLGLSRAEAHALASGDDDMTPLQYRRGTRATDVCKRVVGSFA